MRVSATKYGAIVANKTAVFKAVPRSESRSTAQDESEISMVIDKNAKIMMAIKWRSQFIFLPAAFVSGRASSLGINNCAETPTTTAEVPTIHRHGTSTWVISPITVGDTEPINSPTPVDRNIFFKAVLECEPRIAVAVFPVMTEPPAASATAGTEK